MRRAAFWCARCALVGLVAVSSACSARGLLRQEYVLGGVAAPAAIAEAPQRAERELVVSVGPVEVPAYLRRPQIVTRLEGNRVHASESHVWAENLGQSVGRAVLTNITQWLPTTRATLFPSISVDRVDVRVAIRILELAAQPDGNVALDAFWTLSRVGATDAFLTRRITYATPIDGDGYAGIVDAMNEAVGMMSREIVAALRTLPPSS